jgi:hypothetical protein
VPGHICRLRSIPQLYWEWLSGYHTNSAGFRDPKEIAKGPIDGEVRIFLTGGSTAWSPGVPRDELTIAGQLEYFLNKGHSGNKVRVINAAVPGYCLTQGRIMIENRILDYKPRVIIMFTGYNELVYANMGVNTLRIQDHFNWRSQIDRCIRTEDGKVVPSVPLAPEYKFKLHYLLRKALWNVRVGDRRHHTWAYTPQRIPISIDQFRGTIRRNLSIVGLLARDQGFQVIVALQPNISQTQKRLSFHEKEALKEASSIEGWPDCNIRYTPVLLETMEQAARNYGMKFVSLLDVFDAVEKPIFFDSCHFGDRGNRIVAQKLLPLIEAEINKE